MEKPSLSEKNTYFTKQIIDSLIFGIEAIQLLSKLEDDTQNKQLYTIIKIITICNDLNELVNILPKDEFRRNFQTALLSELQKYTCYKGMQINCLDFYNNFVKRQQVNKQILKKVNQQMGGMGIMFTAAVTALAIIHASVSVSGSVFNSDRFVDQQLAKRGIDPSDPSLLTSVKNRILSVFDKSNAPKHYLSNDEVEQFNLLNYNAQGKCAYLAYIAELCSGACPTPEEWKKRDPNIVQEIINSQSYTDENENFKKSMTEKNYERFLKKDDTLSLGTYYMIGVGLNPYIEDQTISARPTRVPDDEVRDTEWFRQHFKTGDLKYEPGKTKSDLAIATSFIQGHAFNLLYNRNNQRLCINEVDFENESDYYLTKFRKPSYICEEGFFTNEQLSKLERVGFFPVVKTVKDIFYEHHGRDSIFAITPSDKIFIHDNEYNSGNINEYINIHKAVIDAIIRGKQESYEVMKRYQDDLKLVPEVVELYGSKIKNIDIEDFTKHPSAESQYNLQAMLLSVKAQQAKIAHEREQVQSHAPGEIPGLTHTQNAGKRKFANRRNRRLTKKKRRKEENESKVFLK